METHGIIPAGWIEPPKLDAPSMFVALQEQIGAAAGIDHRPIEKLVIDHAKKPSEN